MPGSSVLLAKLELHAELSYNKEILSSNQGGSYYKLVFLTHRYELVKKKIQRGWKKASSGNKILPVQVPLMLLDPIPLMNLIKVPFRLWSYQISKEI